MSKLLFIANPRFGKARIKNRLLDTLDIFTEAGWEYQVHITQALLDTRDRAALHGGGVNMIVCSGGDGTLSETISGMMELEQPPVLGYIPSGSTNDFVSSLRIPSNMRVAAANVMEGVRYPIDIGRFCGDRYLAYVTGFGVFTEASYLIFQDKENVLGHQACMLEGVKSLVNLKSYNMRIEAEDFALKGDFIFGMVTNVISMGGFKGLVTQDAALNDGLFEVPMICTPKAPLDLSNIISYTFLKEEQSEYVHKLKTSHLRITSEEPVDRVLDGEFGGSHAEVEVENLLRKIEIMASLAKKS